MKIIDYYKREYNRMELMLAHYTEWGYSPELSDLVRILSTAKEELRKKIQGLQ